MLIYKCLCMLMYTYIYAYVCLYINEMDDSNETRDRRKELGFFGYYRHSHYPLSCIVLFESGLGFIVNVYCKL